MVEQAGIGGRVAAWGAADGALVHLDDLVDVLQPLDAAVGQWLCLAAVVVLAEDGVERVAHQGALAAAAHPGHADELAQRQRQVHVLQVVAGGPEQLDLPAIAGAPLPGHGNAEVAAEVAGRGAFALHQVARVALGHDAPAMLAGAGADIDQVVGAHHHLPVVLHHQHAVAAIAQFAQAADEAAVVARMQPDARFVQDVEHTGQLAADLCGQADALRFATAEGARAAVQGEVVEAHVQQEARAAGDLLDHLMCDEGLLLIEVCVQAFHLGMQLGDAHAGELEDVAAVQAEVQGVLLEARTVAGGAGHHVGEACGPLLRGLGAVVGLLHHIGDEPLELHAAVAQPDGAAHPQRFIEAVEQCRYHSVVHLGHGAVQVMAELLQHGLHLLEDPVALVGAQWQEGPPPDALAAVRHDLVQGHLRHLAQAAALGACSVGAVEAEQVGLGLLVGDAARGAHEVAAQVARLLLVHTHHHQRALAILHGRGAGVGQPLGIGGVHL